MNFALSIVHKTSHDLTLARLLDRGYIRPAILLVSGTAATITIIRHFL